MGRTVITADDLLPPRADTEVSGVTATTSAASVPTADDYVARLMKYIPTEVVALFLFLDGIIKAAAAPLWISWVVFLVLIIGTWAYLARVARVEKQRQLLISTAAFAVWVFALGGPFETLSWYKRIYGSLLLPLYTFAIPIISPDPFNRDRN